MADLSGRELGGCRLLKPIGIGGMGEVYLAEQTRLGNRPVAVKVVRLDDATLSPEKLAEVERRFRREAALLGSFSHPNILPVHDAGVEDGLLYLVMDYVPDGSLADAIRPGPAQKLAPPVAPALAAELIGQVAAALQYTHDRDVVHRDVKPGNILARKTSDGKWQLLLADFGVAKAMQEASQKTQVTGTLIYMAPEQFTGTFSPASDQYALGVVAYQLLTGRPPFEGDLATVTQAHLNQPPPSMRVANPAISPALDAVVMRALAKRPGDRFPNVTAFADALREAAAAPAPARAPTPSAPAQWPSPQQSDAATPKPGLARAWLAVLAAVVLLVGAVGGAGVLRIHNQQVSVQATQTAAAQAAQTAAARATGSTAPGTTPVQAGATQTAAAIIATVTASAYIPTATATAGLGTDITSPPPAPAQANALVFADSSPRCHGSNPAWVVANNTTVLCPGNGGVELQVKAAGSLACIEQHNVPNDAYISVLVTPQGNSETTGPVLGFRQGQVTIGTSTPGTIEYAGVGYYYSLVKASAVYNLYEYNTARQQATITNGTLPTGPAADFAMGVLVHGDQFTLYVNGQPIAGPVTNGAHATGWIALCTSGDTIFRDVQVYNLKTS
jgi:tRNA A-37 threonylcarbamoyl transferase component Bud32